MTGKGLMRYKRLMFGVNCAPEIFQRIMEEMLAGCEGTVNYIDDILISGPDKATHDSRLKKVSSILKQNNAQLNGKKCVYGAKQVDFLGFIISSSGIKPSETKVNALKNFRKPETVEEIRSFLGLVPMLVILSRIWQLKRNR